MNWDQDKSISLSQVCVCAFALLLVCLAAGLWFLPFFVGTMAAAFMALIVRIVKNAFQQAMLMKDELDYTV